MRKILYVSGTRADYGLMKSVLFNIKHHSELDLEIAVTGMHFMKQFGYSIREIEKDGFKIHKIKTIYEKDDKESMARFIGKFILQFTGIVKKSKPDIMLVLGDRAEMLAAAIVGAYFTIPVVHLHGGEVTSTVDEFARHAITKLAHIHLSATKKSAERIIKMGEEPWRVHMTGAPGLDSIINKKLFSKNDVFKKLGLNAYKKTILILQHPVTIESDEAQEQIKSTLEAVSQLKCQVVVIYPNADAGGRKMIKIIEKYRKKTNFRIFKNLNYELYLSLMKHADVIVGNSSSGIIEAPSFKLPVVNIGTRQEGRERAKNVIDVPHDKEKIKKAIKKAIGKPFKNSLKNIKNPYGDGKAGARVAKILANIKINKKLLQKTLSY